MDDDADRPLLARHRRAHSSSLQERAKATASALAAAKSSASAPARSLAMGHPGQLAQLLDAPRARAAPPRRRPAGPGVAAAR